VRFPSGTNLQLDRRFAQPSITQDRLIAKLIAVRDQSQASGNHAEPSNVQIRPL